MNLGNFKDIPIFVTKVYNKDFIHPFMTIFHDHKKAKKLIKVGKDSLNMVVYNMVTSV